MTVHELTFVFLNLGSMAMLVFLIGRRLYQVPVAAGAAAPATDAGSGGAGSKLAVALSPYWLGGKHSGSKTSSRKHIGFDSGQAAKR